MVKKIFIAVASIFIFLIVGFFLALEKEDINAKIENKVLTHEVVLEELKNEKFVLFILNSQCQGCNSGIEVIKEDIQFCKTHNINYLIVFDELINENVDAKIMDFKQRNDFNEKVFLINPAHYETNISIVASHRRLKNFLNHFVPKVDKIVLGYPQYFYFKNGKYKGNSFYEMEINSKKYF